MEILVKMLPIIFPLYTRHFKIYIMLKDCHENSNNTGFQHGLERRVLHVLFENLRTAVWWLLRFWNCLEADIIHRNDSYYCWRNNRAFRFVKRLVRIHKQLVYPFSNLWSRNWKNVAESACRISQWLEVIGMKWKTACVGVSSVDFACVLSHDTRKYFIGASESALNTKEYYMPSSSSKIQSFELLLKHSYRTPQSQMIIMQTGIFVKHHPQDSANPTPVATDIGP